jgi:hypothetical protein
MSLLRLRALPPRFPRALRGCASCHSAGRGRSAARVWRAPTRRPSSPSGRRSTSSATCGAPFGRSSPPSGRASATTGSCAGTGGRTGRTSCRAREWRSSPGRATVCCPETSVSRPTRPCRSRWSQRGCGISSPPTPSSWASKGFDLRLDRSRSTAFGMGDTHWFVEFAQFEDGIPVEGANVFFRLNHGNLVQFGADRVAPVDLDTQPALERDAAFAAALRELQFPASSRLAEVLDAGSLHVFPVAPPDESPGERFAGVAGTGYSHKLVWKFVFRLPGEATTYRGALSTPTATWSWRCAISPPTVDATVTGGIYPTTNTDPEVVVNVSVRDPHQLDEQDHRRRRGLRLQRRHGDDRPQWEVLPDVGCVRNDLAFELDRRQSRLRHERRHRLHDPGRRGGGQHPRFAQRHVPPDADQSQRGELLPCQRVAGEQGDRQHEHQSDLQCLLERLVGQLLPLGRRLLEHRRARRGLPARVGTRPRHQHRRRGEQRGQGSGEAVGDTFAFLETRDACIGQNFLPAELPQLRRPARASATSRTSGIAGPATLATASRT